MGIRSILFLSGYLVIVFALNRHLARPMTSSDPAGNGMARGLAAIFAYGLLLPIFCGLYTAVGIFTLKNSLDWSLISRVTWRVTIFAVACGLIVTVLDALPYRFLSASTLESLALCYVSVSISFLLCYLVLLVAIPKGVEHYFVRSIALHAVSLVAIAIINLRMG
jgi:hypothetical protein